MQRLGRFLGIIGLVSLFSLPLTLLLWNWQWTAMAWSKLGLGLLGTGVWLVVCAPQIRSSVSGRLTFFGGVQVVLGLLALGSAALLYTLTRLHPQRLDLTEESVFTLSEQTLSLLGALAEDVRVLAFYSAQDPHYRLVREALEAYRHGSPRFQVEFVDPGVRQDLVEKNKIHRGGPRILLRHRGKEERVALDSGRYPSAEEALTAALLALTRNDPKKKLCFVTGHAERSLEGNDPASRVTRLAADLESEGYLLEPLSLLSGPDLQTRCQLVLLIGPQQALSEDEQRRLDSAIKSGVRLLAFLGAQDSTSTDELLRRMGISLAPHTVLQPDGRHPLEALSDPVRNATAHPIFSVFFRATPAQLGALQALLPLARPVRPLVNLPSSLAVVPLISTSAEAWGESDAIPEDGSAERNPGKDLLGPIPLAVAAEQSTASGSDLAAPLTRVAVFGSSAMVTDAVYAAIAFNRDLILNTVAWLVQQEAKISIRPRVRAASHLRLTESDLQFVTFFSMDVLPLLLLIFGLAVWQGRRWSG